MDTRRAFGSSSSLSRAMRSAALDTELVASADRHPRRATPSTELYAASTEPVLRSGSRNLPSEAQQDRCAVVVDSALRSDNYNMEDNYDVRSVMSGRSSRSNKSTSSQEALNRKARLAALELEQQFRQREAHLKRTRLAAC